MFLTPWIKSNLTKIYSGIKITNAEMLHVVGTCGNCQHWNPPADEKGETSPHTIWCEAYEDSDQTCTEWQGNEEQEQIG